MPDSNDEVTEAFRKIRWDTAYRIQDLMVMRDAILHKGAGHKVQTMIKHNSVEMWYVTAMGVPIRYHFERPDITASSHILDGQKEECPKITNFAIDALDNDSEIITCDHGFGNEGNDYYSLIVSLERHGKTSTVTWVVL